MMRVFSNFMTSPDVEIVLLRYFWVIFVAFLCPHIFTVLSEPRATARREM